MSRNRESQVYRVRQLPLHLKDRGATTAFLAGIAPVLGAVGNIRVSSLAQGRPDSKTATVSFKTLPSVFDNDESQWTLSTEDVCGRNIIVDTHFQGFTVLSEPQHCPHTVDCIAISGLASHPFGSWKRRESGSDFMWLRDRLPQDVPQLRSLIYGYDTKLFKSHSFQNLDDIAWSFIASLKEIRRSLPPAKPLILLAHSLGGIVLKRALVLLACEDNVEEKRIFESVKGLVFFGVPHKGMTISHFLAMVAKQPNEDLISRTLSPDSTLLIELHKKFTTIASRFNENIRFVYETAESQTTEQTPSGTWVRSATSYAVLVNKDSAVPPETLSRNAIAVDKDHSNMVKFAEDDPVYQIIMSFIFDLSMNPDSQRSSHGNHASLTPVQESAKSFSTVPFPKDPGFVGREDVLAQLESEFANPISQRWASLHGLGGIGKSQIAIEYSYRQRERSPQLSTFWVHASSKARLEQSYAEIATSVEIPGTGDGKVDTLELVSNWLANPDNGPWLLILDNADDATVLLDLIARDTGTRATPVQRRLLDLLPRVHHGTVLITTRDRMCALDLAGDHGTPIEVESMSAFEAVGLLRNKLPNATEEEASELVKELEYVPLAISQAGAYIKAVPLIPIPKYLAIFRCSNEDQASLLNKDRGDMRRDRGVPNAVITSWELSFNQIRERNPDSADLLSIMSYLNRQAIPRFLIQGDTDEISFYESINHLLSFSLIRAEIGEDTFEMHRLVQTATRHWLRSKNYEQLWKDRAIEQVAHQFPMPGHQAQRWPICETLMSHADEVILHPASSKESELSRADILVRTAWYLSERKAHHGLAEQRSTDALQIQRQYFDDDSEELLATLSTLAVIDGALFKLEEARGLQEYILKQRLGKRGPEDAQTLTAMHNLAVSYRDLGQSEKAEDLLKRVVEVKERLLGPEDPQFLSSGNLLAQIYFHQGKYEDAEKLSIRILETSTKCLGVEHIDTLNAMYGLSRTYLRQGKLEEAEYLIGHAIQLFTKTFGPSHQRTLYARMVLAESYYRQKKVDDAETICLLCLDIAQKVHGPQDQTTLNLNGLLGLIYRNQGRFVDASRSLKDVTDSNRELLGTDHPDTLTAMCYLALCYYDMGEKDRAIQLMTEVLDKRKKVLHANHPYIAGTAEWLAYWKREEEEGMEKKGLEEESAEEESMEESVEEESVVEESMEEESMEEESVEEQGMREQLVTRGHSMG